MKLLSQAVPEIIKITTSGAASDKNFMTYLFRRLQFTFLKFPRSLIQSGHGHDSK